MAIPSPRECAELLRALGDETRLQILETLLVEERCVNELVQAMGLGQPHISHHLRILRGAGLVEGRRDGKKVCYRVSPKVRRALRGAAGQALDFGCCQISFPASTLELAARTR
jgi:DNA-binding transcriptional ArsR family regulator